jgi:hypothetical protein
MSTESTAIRLAEKLKQLTVDGKISWRFRALTRDGMEPADAYIAEMPDNEAALIAERRISAGIASYSLFISSEGETFFEAFAEGYPAEPTDEKLRMLRELRELFGAARENAKGTWQKVEKFEQLLERLA